MSLRMLTLAALTSGADKVKTGVREARQEAIAVMQVKNRESQLRLPIALWVKTKTITMKHQSSQTDLLSLWPHLPLSLSLLSHTDHSSWSIFLYKRREKSNSDAEFEWPPRPPISRSCLKSDLSSDLSPGTDHSRGWWPEMPCGFTKTMNLVHTTQTGPASTQRGAGQNCSPQSQLNNKNDLHCEWQFVLRRL